MACNQNRLNCTPDEVFAAVSIPSCGKFVNGDKLQAEQIVFDQSFKDLINNYGVSIDYYINPFNLSAANLLYGEEPTKVFQGPLSSMQMYIELNNEAITLSKFGFDAADDFTGYIHIESFTTAASAFFDYSSVGQVVEPKAGDIVVIPDLACDRPNGRGIRAYEITERMEQDVGNGLNPLLGHYVYRLRAKRYEYSFEPGVPVEPVNSQVFENSFTGVLSTNIPGDSVSDSKFYDSDINVESRDTVFDMDVNDTDIYGSYY